MIAPKSPKKDTLPEYKDSFVEEYKELLGDDGFSAYKEVASHYPSKAIRVNTTKIGVEALKERLHDDWELTPIPWCEEGFWIEHREEDRHDLGNLLEHILGYVYVQSAASMIPPTVMDVQPGMKVLDMCAAPGSKATQLGQLVGDGVVVANDSNGHRLTALGINAQRLGLDNIVVSNMQGQDLPDDDLYDRVLVDAPCSGTGTVMKSHKSMEMWSESLVGRMKGVQRLLIRKGFELLRPGGILVYSTCTLQPEENEGIVSEFLDEYENAGLEPVSLDLNRSEPITSWKGEPYTGVGDVVRIHPQDNWTEGFFVAKIRKKG